MPSGGAGGGGGAPPPPRDHAPDVIGANAVVRNGAELNRAARADQDAALAKRGGEAPSALGAAGDVEEHHVGAPVRRMNPQACDAAESLGQRARVLMILGEPIDHGGQRDDPGSRDYPCLAHPPAQQLARTPRAFHERAPPAQHRSHRAGEPLGETKRNCVGMRRDTARAGLERERRVEDACAVEMDAQATAMRRLGDRGHVREPDRLTAAAVVRVFHRHQGVRREMRIRRRVEFGCELVEVEFAVVGVANGSEDHAAQRSRAARLVEIGVGARAEHRLGAARAMHQHRDQVAHRTAGDQQRRLLAHRGRRHRLEPVNGGVFAVDVVAQLGARDCLAHFRSRQGHRVAAQIDHVSARLLGEDRLDHFVNRALAVWLVGQRPGDGDGRGAARRDSLANQLASVNQ
jgi:hypothetical protein